MRQPQNGKSDKENITCTIDKKKTKKLKRTSHRRYSRVTMENLECINDALRFHQGYGTQGTWKLVPKDSCEVYKDQRNRDTTKTNKEKISGKATGKRTTPGRKTNRRNASDRDRSKSDDESRCSREKSAKSTKKVKKPPKKRRQNNRSSSGESVSSYSTCYSERSASSARSSDTGS